MGALGGQINTGYTFASWIQGLGNIITEASISPA
jgi:hypothetical protein